MTGKARKLTAIPQPSTTTGSGSRIFGEALAHWLQKANRGHKEVAHSIQVQVSALSHWLAGRKRPNPTHLMRLLVHLHTRLGPAWTVADALDTIAPLGWTWEDACQALENLHGPEIPDFREWWEKGQPQPLLPAYLPLPAVYVEREEHRRLREMLTDWAAWRRARWQIVVVTGVAGAGKTTLLAALARDPAVRRSFRDGILWLNGAEKGLLAQAAYRIGLDGPPGVLPEEWARWIGDPRRRLLIVVDDALPDASLDALIAGIGPQVVLVVTTQKGPEVTTALKRRIPQHQLAEIILRGLREEEGFTLMEQVLEERIRERDRETARRIGHLLGWHPEGLRIAAAMARDTDAPESRGAGEPDWAGVLAFLEEEHLRSGEWYPLRQLVAQQWERMGAERRERVEQLVWRTVRGGPLEEPLAKAIWEVQSDTTRHLLRDLERTGLLERVAVHPLEWWREGKVEMWRVTPVVFHLRREAGETADPDGEHQQWRRRAVFREARAARAATPPMPWSLALVATLFHFLGTLPKAVVWAGLLLAGLLLRRRDWTGRWERWTTVWTPISNLRRHLERREVWMAEELELLIGRANETTR